MKHQLVMIAAAAGLVLAQASGSVTLGVPSVPGTRVPESNPGTAQPPPPSAAPSASPAATPSFAGPSGSYSGPAYSFGAAPPPTVSTGR